MRRILTVRRLREQQSNDDLAQTTPAERIGMVWPLTETAWAFKEAADNDRPETPRAPSRLPRHVVRLRRRGRG